MRKSLVFLTSLIFAVLAALLAGPAAADRCPNVQILLDRSGSMLQPTTTGATRWQVATAAVKAVLAKYNGKFPIGMSFFPASQVTCNSHLATVPVYKSQAIIESAMNFILPTGSTPTGSALRDAQQLWPLQDPKRDQYIILITDGGPVCGGEPDTCNGSVAQIEAALKRNPPISTFVVGFGGGLTSAESACLSRMALASGRISKRPERYYRADNAAELNRALSDIIKIVVGGGDAGSLCYR